MLQLSRAAVAACLAAVAAAARDISSWSSMLHIQSLCLLDEHMYSSWSSKNSLAPTLDSQWIWCLKDSLSSLIYNKVTDIKFDLADYLLLLLLLPHHI